MPNLPVHIELAYQTVKQIKHPTLDANVGLFLLGATSPDIRIITRSSRRKYHFTSLDFQKVGAGVEQMLNAHPALAKPDMLNQPTQAFVAGYITHLITDEIWIVDVFRRYFANKKIFSDDIYGKVMDRAIQLDLDSEASCTVNNILHLLKTHTNNVNVDFISVETLTEWRDWVLSFLQQQFSWDRLHFMANRIASGDQTHPAIPIANEFLKSMPQSLEQLHKLIPSSALTQYRKRTIKELTSVLGHYLP